MSNTYFYRDKPLFGLDIGFSSLKVMQIDTFNKRQRVSGYGVVSFDPDAIKDGVIVQPEIIAKAAHQLFSKNLIGTISTHRVAVAIPAARTFNRNVVLPKLSKKEIREALRTEAEQFIPIPVDDLYLDYELIRRGGEENEYLSVAAPKAIVNSYYDLLRIIGLEPVIMDTTISAASRLFVQSKHNDIPTVLIDFGSIFADISIYDNNLIVTGTVAGGGDSFTNLISEKLGVTKQEAYIIKTKYGLGASKKQKEIVSSLTGILDQLVKEIRRMIRYYEERGNTDRKIGQIITMGGGANMPGLADYLTDTLRLPVRMCDPWLQLSFKGLQPPNSMEKSMYATVAGLALMTQSETRK